MEFALDSDTANFFNAFTTGAYTRSDNFNKTNKFDHNLKNILETDC